MGAEKGLGACGGQVLVHVGGCKVWGHAHSSQAPCRYAALRIWGLCVHPGGDAAGLALVAFPWASSPSAVFCLQGSRAGCGAA